MVVLLAATAPLGGCTLCKPVVGAVTGPACWLAHGGADFGHCNREAAAVALAVASAVGAVAGLFTGVASDIHWLSGEAQDPTANWHDPFRTNVDGR